MTGYVGVQMYDHLTEKAPKILIEMYFINKSFIVKNVIIQ